MGAVNICLVPWFYLWLAHALAMVKVWPPTLVTTAMVERALSWRCVLWEMEVAQS